MQNKIKFTKNCEETSICEKELLTTDRILRYSINESFLNISGGGVFVVNSKLNKGQGLVHKRRGATSCKEERKTVGVLVFTEISSALLAFTANSAAQSSAQTHIHSAIVVIDTSNNA